MRERSTFSVWNPEHGAQKKLVSDFGQTLNPDQSHFSPFRVIDSDSLVSDSRVRKICGTGCPQMELWNTKAFSALEYHRPDFQLWF